MIKQLTTLLLIGVLLLTLLTGCNQAGQMMDDATDMIDDATDIVDDAVTPDGNNGSGNVGSDSNGGNNDGGKVGDRDSGNSGSSGNSSNDSNGGNGSGGNGSGGNGSGSNEGYDTNTGENNAPINLNDTAGASSSARITADEAKNIALSHLGVTREQVTHLFAEYEVDDGVPQYDVHFHKGGVEYNYEIDAETGKLLTFEQDDD